MIFFATFTTLMTLCALTYARFNAGKKQGFLLMIALGGLVGQLTGFLSYFPYAAFVNGEALRTSNFSELLQVPFMAASVSLCWLIGSITFYICMTLPSEKNINPHKFQKISTP